MKGLNAHAPKSDLLGAPLACRSITWMIKLYRFVVPKHFWWGLPILDLMHEFAFAKIKSWMFLLHSIFRLVFKTFLLQKGICIILQSEAGRSSIARFQHGNEASRETKALAFLSALKRIGRKLDAVLTDCKNIQDGILKKSLLRCKKVWAKYRRWNLILDSRAPVALRTL